MPPLISVSGLTKAFGSRTLFTDIQFAIDPGEQVGLIGPNGAGKSTLMQILAGNEDLDRGTIAAQRGLRVGFLQQVPKFKEKSTILSTVSESALDPEGGLIYELLSKLQLDGSAPGYPNIHAEAEIKTLSGGWKKRVALARELARQPDLLLLDEPTNHLDVESILWLETFLSSARFATLTVTHDRFFLQRVSQRILELDRRNPNGMLSVKGNYQDYLEAKADLMSAQEKQEITLKNTLRREVEWLRSGTKARTTKQTARINRAYELADKVSELESRNTTRTANIEFKAADYNPKKLIDAKNISKTLGGRELFKNLDLQFAPGSRLGLLGPNGCGKSTLIRTLLGSEKSDTGEIFRSPHLKVAHFEQNRESLNPETPVAKALAPHGDHVIYRGNPVHVRGYLDRFLFSQAQMNMPLGKLSGGEQSRLLIARLMLQEANVLVLDEPTNDLDLATLAILEDCLTEFDGAVLLVTHDRFFLDRVATRILAFNPLGNGETEFFSDVSQWESWHERENALAEERFNAPKPVSRSSSKKQQLSYKDQRELDGMESNIQKTEALIEELGQQMQSPDVIADAVKLTEISQKMAQAEKEMERLYKRWSELEEMRKSAV